MKLTRTDFVEVCDALAAQHAAGDARLGSEKRGGARMAVEHEVLVSTVAPDGTAGESFTALTRDVSYAGVGLLQRHRVPRNSLLIVRLPRKDLEPLVMLCKAIHVREMAEGIYAIGAEFVRETTLGTPGADAAEVDRVRKAMMR